MNKNDFLTLNIPTNYDDGEAAPPTVLRVVRHKSDSTKVIAKSARPEAFELVGIAGETWEGSRYHMVECDLDAGFRAKLTQWVDELLDGKHTLTVERPALPPASEAAKAAAQMLGDFLLLPSWADVDPGELN